MRAFPAVIRGSLRLLWAEIQGVQNVTALNRKRNGTLGHVFATIEARLRTGQDVLFENRVSFAIEAF